MLETTGQNAVHAIDNAIICSMRKHGSLRKKFISIC